MIIAGVATNQDQSAPLLEELQQSFNVARVDDVEDRERQ
jgi:hypothetical protein